MTAYWTGDQASVIITYSLRCPNPPWQGVPVIVLQMKYGFSPTREVHIYVVLVGGSVS